MDNRHRVQLPPGSRSLSLDPPLPHYSRLSNPRKRSTRAGKFGRQFGRTILCRLDHVTESSQTHSIGNGEPWARHAGQYATGWLPNFLHGSLSNCPQYGDQSHRIDGHLRNQTLTVHCAIHIACYLLDDGQVTSDEGNIPLYAYSLHLSPGREIVGISQDYSTSVELDP